MSAVVASAVRIPKDAKLSPNVEIPLTIKHPEKVQAIARVMCHSHFGFHRLAIINNSVVLFDHDLTHEEEWKELGGKPSRCSVTLKCMQNQSFSGLPDAFRPYMEIAKRKRYDRRWARHRAYMRRQRLNEGGDAFSKMRRYVGLVLRHRCNYESIRKADVLDIEIVMNRTNASVEGLARRGLEIHANPNAAKKCPMVVGLKLGLVKGWRKKINSLAMTSIDGHLILEVHARTNDKFATYTAQVLVERTQDVPDAVGCHREWHFDKKWTTIQHRNGFWHLGEFADRAYGQFRPRKTVGENQGAVK
jgi:hypothetical protein